MMPIPNDYAEIINTLLSATDSGRANWSSTEYGFIISVLESRFSIWSGTDEETGVGFVSFALTDSKGRNLDTWYVDANEDEYDLMRRLYAGAKRQALGISKILSSIKDALSKGGTIGEDDAPF